ncbi:MAG TPA: NAD(P)H-binding protein [Steroidobacteraceae bacterium]
MAVTSAQPGSGAGRSGTVLVTGGTGHLGRDLVKRLVAGGHNVRLLARRPGSETDVRWVQGDLATGAGIAEALQGVDTVLNAATLSPIARRGAMRLSDLFSSPSSVDVDGTRRLLEASARSRVRHFLHVSVVGLDGGGLPYTRLKLAGERLVRQSPLPWSVVRATPFYYMLANMLAGFRRLPVWPLPNSRWNPVDTTDVADYLAECLEDGLRGLREEIRGPEDLSVVEMAREFQRSRGLRRPILSIPLGTGMARKMGFVRSEGRRGRKTWSDWLGEHTVQPTP